MIWLLVGYMFLFIHRPFEVWPVLGPCRIELLYMLFTGAVWLVYPHKRFSFCSIHGTLLAFALAVLLCAVASPWSDACWLTVENYAKILVFYLLLVTSVRDERDLKRLLLGLMLVMAVYMLHSLWEFTNGRHVVRMGIVRMIGVGTTGGDPNSFAASIVLALVFVPALWSAFGRLVHGFLIGFLALGIVCVSLTGSRGAFVSLIVWAVIAVWRSQWRWGLLFGLALAAPILWGALSDRLQNRFETIIDPSVGPANAQVSAEGRLVGLQVGIGLWLDHPLTGVGPGAWIPATGRDLQSHNCYGQLLGETGLLGGMTLAAYLLAVGLSILWIRRTCRLEPGGEVSFCYRLAGGAALGYFLLLFEGNFGHNLFRYNWVWYGAFVAIARQVVAGRWAEASSGMAWQEAEPSGAVPAMAVEAV